MLNKELEYGNNLRTAFEKVFIHQKAKLDGKQTMEVEVLWDTQEKTWEPLNIIKADGPITVAQYEKENNQ